MSKDSPLSQKEKITFKDLSSFIEIAHADPYVPSLPVSKVMKEELDDNIDRKIFVFERASQFDLLSKNSDTFMWISPAPTDLVERYGLVQRRCAENKKKYKDVLIFREGYKLTELDRKFIQEINKSKNKNL